MLKSRDQYLDAYLAVVPVTTTALATPSPQHDTQAWARAVVLVSGDGTLSTVQAVQSHPTVTASSAYTAGDCVGGLLTLTGALGASLSGLLSSIEVASKSVQTTGYHLYLFNANPTGSTFTDKSAPSIAAADLPKLVGAFVLGAADSGLGMTINGLTGINAPVTAAATTLYAVLTCVATPTYASTSDVYVTTTFLRE